LSKKKRRRKKEEWFTSIRNLFFLFPASAYINNIHYMYVGNYVQENALNSSPLRNIEKNIHSNFFSITKRPWRELYIDVYIYKKGYISHIYFFFHIYTCILVALGKLFGVVL
jgi:hypothetical protein